MPKRKRDMKAVALYKRTRRRILTKRPFVVRRPIVKKTGHTLSQTQKSALKKLVAEDVAVHDAFMDNTAITNTFQLMPTAVGNAFFSLSNVQTVVGNQARPAERNGDSIKALNMDLRGTVTFYAGNSQKVRLLLVQFQDIDGAAIDQVVPNTFAQDQPFLLVDGFRVRKPDIKYKILKDITIGYDPKAAVGGGVSSVHKSFRIYHKFSDKESSMNYVVGQGQGTGPTTNVIQLFAVVGSPRQPSGAALATDAAPYLSYQCRQRYMK